MKQIFPINVVTCPICLKESIENGVTKKLPQLLVWQTNGYPINGWRGWCRSKGHYYCPTHSPEVHCE